MDKFKKVMWLQFLLLIPYVIIRILMLQVFGWQLIAIYLCGVLAILSLVTWILLTFIKSFKRLNIIYSVLLVFILIRIIVESNHIVLYIYGISIIFALPIWIYIKKKNTALPFFSLAFYLFLFLFILIGGWI